MSTERWLNTLDLQRAFDYAQATGDLDPTILFVCPRQSGKTTALFDMFLQTQNSVFATPYGSQVHNLRRRARLHNTRGDNLLAAHDIIPLTGINPMRGRMRGFGCLFIDDLDGYTGDYDELMQCIYPVMMQTGDQRRGIIATTTPQGNRTESFYEEHFKYIRRPFTEDLVARREDFKRDYFDDEDFTI